MTSTSTFDLSTCDGRTVKRPHTILDLAFPPPTVPHGEGFRDAALDVLTSKAPRTAETWKRKQVRRAVTAQGHCRLGTGYVGVT
jgi:hypothetical protein